MWNTAIGWNGLNKSESFMTVIFKVNLIQTGLSKGLSKRNETWKKGLKTFQRKILKLSISLIKFQWRQQLLLDISKVTDI